MGDSLVEAIPMNPQKYQQWLQSQRDCFAKWDDLLQRTLCINHDQLQNIEIDRVLLGFLGEAFDERLCVLPSYNPGWDRWDMEYTYTIDLDLEVFTISNTAHYRLDRVPKDKVWIRALDVDQSYYIPGRYGRRFVHPRLAPEESLASLVVKCSAFTPNNEVYWESLPRRKVHPAIGCELAASTSVKIRLKLFSIFAKEHFQAIDAAMLSWNTEDLPFREVIFFIICLAAGGAHLSLVDERRICRSSNNDATFVALASDKYPQREKELVSPLGSGFHLQDQPVGSAPNSSKYWFEGALICLVHQPCSSPDVLRKAMGDAIRYGRETCKRISFNAVVISITEVILLKAFPDGSVEYSSPLNLFEDVCSGLSARERYNDIWLEKTYEREIERKAEKAAAEESYEEKRAAIEKDAAKKTKMEEQALLDEPTDAGLAGQQTMRKRAEGNQARKKAIVKKSTAVEDDSSKYEIKCRSMRKSSVDSIAETDVQEVCHERPTGDRRAIDATWANSATKEHGNEASKESGYVWTTNDTFLVLVQFFEATTRETLKPTDQNGRKLPVEILDNILGYVFDTETYNACAKVSRIFRELCRKRSRILDGVIFDDILQGAGINSCLSSPQDQFHAVEISSGRQMIVTWEPAPTLNTWDKQGKDSNFRFIIGSERQRKLFCPDCPLLIKGLDVQAPPESDTANISTEPDPFVDGFLKESGDNPWSKVWTQNMVTAQSSTYVLGRYWESLIREMFPEQVKSNRACFQETQIQDWASPPNTKAFTISTDFWLQEDFHHVLYLRVKRESRYWDLWDDIVREAGQALDCVDNDYRLMSKGMVQKVGMGNPLVVLVVGRYVRLFKWHEGKTADESGTLDSLFPGIYSIGNVEQRKPIETVLRLALARMSAAKIKEGAQA
ncbi:MAG: hypothetical protein Q9170_002425 [Blastenia crenularia]